MTNRKSVKEKLTEAVLAEIPSAENIYVGLSIEDVVTSWWYTRRHNGYRLTEEGKRGFNLANIEFYDYEFKQDGRSYHSFIMDLNKKIQCPYYIGLNKKNDARTLYIRLYDSKIAMMLGLYGNLQEYLDSIKVKS